MPVPVSLSCKASCMNANTCAPRLSPETWLQTGLGDIAPRSPVTTLALESNVFWLQHPGNNNTEVHFRDLALHRGPNWKHLQSANHVMEIHSLTVENVCALSVTSHWLTREWAQLQQQLKKTTKEHYQQPWPETLSCHWRWRRQRCCFFDCAVVFPITEWCRALQKIKINK